jgi:hypothetical protein
MYLCTSAPSIFLLICSTRLGCGQEGSSGVEYGQIKSNLVRWDKWGSILFKWGEVKSDWTRWDQMRSDKVRLVQVRLFWGWGRGRVKGWIKLCEMLDDRLEQKLDEGRNKMNEWYAYRVVDMRLGKEKDEWTVWWEDGWAVRLKFDEIRLGKRFCERLGARLGEKLGLC